MEPPSVTPPVRSVTAAEAVPQHRPASPLWTVERFGRQLVRNGEHYWWENRNRVPHGIVVFQYTDAGAVTLRTGRQSHTVPTGHAMIFSYGEDSGYGLDDSNRGPYQCTWLVLTGAGVSEHWQAFRAQHGSIIELGKQSPALKKLDKVVELGNQRSQIGNATIAMASFGFMTELFGAVERKRADRLSPVRRAMEFILANPLGPWSLKEVAHRFGVSREHLTRVFTDELTETPYHWVNERRLEHALTLLRDSDLSLAVVAEQAGYASAHTLSRQVRAKTGFGPGAYRARHRAG